MDAATDVIYDVTVQYDVNARFPVALNMASISAHISGNQSHYGSDVFDYEIFDPELFIAEHDVNVYLDLSLVNIFLIILYGIIFIIGLLGNMFVIIAIVKFKSLRTLTNFFLVNLTIGDVLVILVCIPVTLGNTVYKKWIYGEVLCKLTPFIQGTAVCVSVLSLLAISISRYFAIYKPLSAKIVFSKRNVRIMLLAIWIISFATMSPLLYVNSVTTIEYFDLLEIKICEENWPSLSDKNVYNTFIFCTLFIIPFVLISFAYAVIGHTLWWSNTYLMEEVTSCQQRRNNMILRQRRRTVKMLVSVVVMFLICWLPYYCTTLWLDFNLLDVDKRALLTWLHTYVYPLVTLLALGNSAVNPICYCLMSKSFRRGLYEMCCHGVWHRSGHFLRNSFKIKSTLSESFDTANV